DKLKTGVDQFAHYFELPLIKINRQSTKKHLGILANITKEPVAFAKNGNYWRFRAYVIEEVLKQTPYQLLAYRFDDVNKESRTVLGYEIHDQCFHPVQATLPVLTYDWAIGGSHALKEHSSFKRMDE